jgi:hypothetical protein
VDTAPFDWIASTILHDLAQHGTSAAAAAVLLRSYVDSGRAELGDASATALTEGLRVWASLRDPVERTEWLGVFADASAISDDERLPHMVQEQLAGTIDALEQFVRASYEPGEGLIGSACLSQLRCASALLTAFELTGRLPYSMLAEEILRAAHRQWWSEARVFADDFAASCLDVQVASRLAALHRDPEYAASAVVAPDAHYEEDARRTLAGLAVEYRDHPEHAAVYGVALAHWSALNSQTNPG